MDVNALNTLDQNKKRTLLKQLLGKLQTTSAPARNPDIAIVGLSGRYPMANNMEQLWEQLRGGKSAISQIPPDRWRAEQFLDASRKDENRAYTGWGGFINDWDAFDAQLFHISPREAQAMDPQERLVLQTVWEVFEDAGYSRTNVLPISPKTGVFIGAMNANYEFIGGMQWERSGKTGAHSSFWSIANRISYFFDLQGPSMTVDTACSSSLTALHLACSSIRKGECDAAIAGGVNLILHPAHYVRLCQMEMLSAGEQCRTFGMNADGFVDGEGVGAVLLKPLEQAIQAGDRIYGVIKGSSVNAGGRTSGFTVPNPAAQQELIASALEDAGVDPRTISYIEAHGTGTPLGDPIEIRGLSGAFERSTADRQFCAVGSIKPNIGHLESAAGIAGLTKVLLQLQHGMLAPSIHAEPQNVNIDFVNSPFYVQKELSEWKRPTLHLNGEEREFPRRAGISSFGAGGANAHVIIEEYRGEPAAPAATGDMLSPQVFVLSARDEERLLAYAALMRDFLKRNAGLSWDNAAYTLQVGRELMPQRLAVAAADLHDLLRKLDAYCAGEQVEGMYTGRTAAVNRREEASSEAALTALRAKDMPALAKLWVSGEFVDWRLLYSGGQKRIRLPFYPFAQDRYSLLPGYAPSQAAHSAEGEVPISPSPELLYYTEKWLPRPLPARGRQEEPSGSLLLIGAAAELAASIESQTGRSVTRVNWAEQFREVGQSTYSLHPAREEDYAMLFDRLVHSGEWPAAVMIFSDSSCRDAELPALSVDPDSETAVVRDVYALGFILRAANRKGSRGLPKVIYAYNAAGDASAVWKRAIGAYSSSARLVYADTDIISVQLDWTDSALAAGLLLQELGAADGEMANEVVYKDGQRQIKVMKQISLEPSSHQLNITGGVCLITGGFGALACLTARHLADVHQMKVVLVGRSPLHEERSRRLAEMNSAGLIRYIQADVTDQEAMKQAIERINRELGPVTGVIHAAGIAGDGTIAERSVPDMARTLAPKLQGTRVLDEATLNQPLAFFVLYSSVSSVIGDFGQCDYAVSNRFLDAYAAYRNALHQQGRRSGRTISINWPLWEAGGMHLAGGAEQLYIQATGFTPLPVHEGLLTLEQLLHGRMAQNTVAVFYGKSERVNALLQINTAASGTGESSRLANDNNDSGLLQRQVLAELQELAAQVLGSAAQRIQPDESLGSFGFDSITLRKLSLKINERFHIQTNTTVFFAYSSLAELSEYLVDTYPGELQSCLQAQTTASPSVIPTADSEEGMSRDRRLEPVAIIGMAGMFPKSPNLEQFWQNLMEGTDCVMEIPPERWDWREVYGDPRLESNKTNCKWGAFVEDVDRFDASFFRISAIEAERMDPQQRLFLQTVWSAVEHAGYPMSEFHGRRTGVFVGAQFNDYLKLVEHAESGAAQTATGNALAMIANRVSYQFNFAGPSETIDTACSSSLVAVNRAIRAIQCGECEQAIAGGVSLMLHPSTMIGASQLGVLSAEGKCKTFDKDADGYVKGEGIGAVVLKPLSRAQEDGDTIYAVIKGSSVNHGGRASSLTAPNSKAQAALLADSYSEAGFGLHTVTYLELHGTGTVLGDPVEVEGIKMAGKQGDDGIEGRQLNAASCGLGSVKSNIGHLEPASGIAGLLKVVLAMNEGMLPASQHVKERNPLLKLEGTPFYIVEHNKRWDRLVDAEGREIPRRAGVSSFGFGGANAHVVLEEYTGRAAAPGNESQPQRPALIVLSAKSEQQLRSCAQQLSGHLEGRGWLDADLQDIAYTLQTGREAMEERLAFTVQSIGELQQRLRAYHAGEPNAEDMYRGSVGSDREHLNARYPDEKREQMMERWLADAAYGELLKLWVKGLSVDWKKLHQGAARRRLGLPAYPFAKQRYWAPASGQKSAVEASFKRQPYSGSFRAIHPLLHTNLSSASGLRYSTTFNGTEFFLSDHQVKGQPILPGAAYLEMVRAAACLAMDRSPAEHIDMRIQQVQWLRPVAVSAQTASVQVELVPVKDGAFSFVIHDGTQSKAAKRTVYCQGMLLLQESGFMGVRRDLSALRKACSRKVITSQAWYGMFDQVGIAYGPAFQGVKQVHLGEGEALAQLQLDSSLIGTLNEYELHPSMLDAAMQAAASLIAEHHPGRAAIAVSLEEVSWSGPCEEQMWAWVRYGQGMRAAEALQRFEIELCNAQGDAIVQMNGFVSKVEQKPAGEFAVNQAEEDKRGYRPLGSVMFTPVWEAVKGSPSGTLAESREPMVVIGAKETQLTKLRKQFPHVRHVELGQRTVEEIAELLQQQGPIDHIVWAAPEPGAAFLMSSQANWHRDTLAVFRLIKAMHAIGYHERKLIWTLITHEVCPVYDTITVNAAHAAVHGLAGSAVKEYPNWTFNMVDLEANMDWTEVDVFSAAPEQYGEPRAYRKGEWFKRELAAYQPSRRELAPLTRRGVYVIIGGAGTIGQAWSEYMIRNYQAQIVWIGRRPKEEAAAGLRRLSKLGAEPLYIRADAARPDELREAYKAIKGKFGVIHGLVHSGVVFAENELNQLDEEALLAALASKVDSSIHMAQVFAEEPLEWVLFFSSINSFLQARKQSGYSAGCMFQDTFAKLLSQHLPCPVKVMNWGYWERAAEGEEQATFEYWKEQMGIETITPQEGMEALNELLQCPLDQLAYMKVRKASGYEGLQLMNEQLCQTGSTTEVDPERILERIPQARERIDDLARPMKQMEEQFGQLLWVQMNQAGLFPSDKPVAELPAHLPKEQRELYERWFQGTLPVLEEKGYLVRMASGLCPAPFTQPELQAAWEEWEGHKKVWINDNRMVSQLLLVETMLQALPDILTGKRKATDVMFPGSSMKLVEGVYKNNPFADFFNHVTAQVVVAYIKECIRANPKARIRLLEIGAGTGGTSNIIFQQLQPYQSYIHEYVYTDISKAFLMHAQQAYGERNPYLKYHLFNVEEPIEGQGLKHGEYDLVVATNVLHATQNIRQTLRNAHALLKRNGLIVINEITDQSLFTHLTFGLLSGWWLHNDPALRIPHSPGLYAGTWKRVLEQEGFHTVIAPADQAKALGQQVFAAASKGVVRQAVDQDKAATKEPLQLQQQAGRKAGHARRQPTPALRSKGEEQRLIEQHIRREITAKLAETLQTDPASISTSEPFADYGVDSILGIHLVQVINKALNTELDTTSLFDHSSVDKLTGYIASRYRDRFASLIEQGGASTVSAAVPAAEEAEAWEDAEEAYLEAGLGKEEDQASTAVQREREDLIAVIGMSGQFPDAEDIDLFWDNLTKGHDAVRELPKAYLDEHLSHSAQERGRAYCKWGGVLEQRDCFDPLFFNISPREAASMNPHQRLILQESWRALENAGCNPKTLAESRTGMFIGAEPTGYFHESFTGFSDAIVASRLSYYLNLNGPALVVNTGCSSSGAALHLACESLRSGESSMALAGGVVAYLNSATLKTLSEIEMLSPTGKCYAFDEAADGTVLSEGVGVVVLKRLKDAVADGDSIYGVIAASGMNQDGASNGITAPSGAAQEQLIRDVYDKYHIHPEEITYVEAHGTGTKLGDPIETNALIRAFSHYTDKQGYCALGTVKSHIGHTGAAAGVIGLMKVLLCIRHRKLPGLIHFKTMNPFIDLKSSPFYVSNEAQDWERAGDRPLTAALSSFGHSGTNTHFVIREYLPTAGTVGRQPERSAPQPTIIPLSAKNKERLQEYAHVLLRYLKREAAPVVRVSGKRGTAVELQTLELQLTAIVGGILLVDPAELEPGMAMEEYGMDLVQLAEFQRNVQRELGLNIQPSQWLEWDSIADVAAGLYHMYEELADAKEFSTEQPPSIAIPAVDLQALAYTLQTGREMMEERVAFLVSDVAELIAKLEKYAAGEGLAQCWTGNSSGDQEALRLLAADDGMQLVIRQWVAGAEYSKIAQLWVRHFDFDWEMLYSLERPRRIHLPGYPFAKERYWKKPQRKPEGVIRDVSHAFLHPLLHRNTSNLMEQQYRSAFTGEEFFLADHVIHGQRILPGTAHLELARAAVQDAAGPLQGTPARIRLKQVMWVQPVVDQGQGVKLAISLTPKENQDIGYSIYTPAASAGETRLVHSQGTAECLEPDSPPVIELEELKRRCSYGMLEAADCYASFEKMGIQYGAAFRSLEKVWIGEGEAVARLSQAEASPLFTLHPGMLDAALQSAVGLMSGSSLAAAEGKPDQPLVPFALEQLDIYGALSTSIWVHVRYSEGALSQGSVRKLDLVLYGDNGQACAALKGLACRAMENKAEWPEAESSEPLLFLPTWQEARAGNLPEKSYARRDMILIGGAFQDLLELSELMPEANCHALVSQAEDAALAFEETAVQLLAHVQKLVSDKKSMQDALLQLVLLPGVEQACYEGLIGLLRSVLKEQPQLRAQLITLDEPMNAASLKQIADENARERDVYLRYHRGVRQVMLWQELKGGNPSASGSAGRLPWKDGGTYLITGGAGGLGLIFAREILERTEQAVIVLVGRSPSPSLSFAELEQSSGKARVIYRACDISDGRQVDALIAGISNEFGALNGIIHSAGMIKDNYVIRKQPSEFREVLSPKVAGLVNLDRATRAMRLDFMLLFSSGAGALGNEGQTDYAAANAFMDRFARFRSEQVAQGRRSGHTLSLNWPLWKEGGMQVSSETAARMKQEYGMTAMNAKDGIQALYAAYESGQPQVLVIYGEGERIRANLAKPVLPESRDASAPISSIAVRRLDQGELKERMAAYLKQVLSSVLGMEEQHINEQTQLDKYGLDSVMIMDVNNKLERDFEQLSRTLFFEYATVAELAGYFAAFHTDKLIQLFGGQAGDSGSAGEDSVLEPKQEHEYADARQLQLTAAAEQELEPRARQRFIGVSGMATHSSPVKLQDSRGSDARPAIDQVHEAIDQGKLTIDDLVSCAALPVIHRRPAVSVNNEKQEAVLIHEDELPSHPEIYEVIERIDRMHPPIGYERILYPYYFICADRSQYIRVIVDEASAVIIPFMPVEEEIYKELCRTASSSDKQVLLVDFQKSWADPEELRQIPLGVWQDLNIQSFTLAGNKMRKLRYLVDKFRKLGDVRTVEYDAQGPVPYEQLRDIMLGWCSSKKNVIRHSLLCMEELLTGKLASEYRAFLTYRGEQLCSAIVVEKTGEGAYLMDQEYYDPKAAPLGHMEYAISEIIALLKQEQAVSFSLGLTWYPFVFENKPGTDPEGWRWLKEHDEKQTLLSRIFSQGQTNYQFKKKFGEAGVPIIAYLPRQAPLSLLMKYWPVFYQNSLSEERAREVIEGIQLPLAERPAIGEAATLTAEDRQELLAEAKGRLELLAYHEHPLDLMTDSWGLVQSEAVKRRLQETRNRGQEDVLEAFKSLFPFKHLMFTGEGKLAEDLFYQAFAEYTPVTKRRIATAIPWTTTLMSQLKYGFDVIELPHASVMEHDSSYLYKGEINLALLGKELTSNGPSVAMAAIELLNNGTGGHPVRLSHLRELKGLLQEHQIPLVMDASRIVRNAYLLKQHDPDCTMLGLWEIMRLLAEEAEHVVMSLSKDFTVPGGGLVATNDDRLAAAIGRHQEEKGLALPVERQQAMMRAALDHSQIEAYLMKQMAFTKRVSERLQQLGVPILQPACGHAVVLMAGGFSEGATTAEKKEAFLRKLFLSTGIRGGLHQAGKQRNTVLSECIRLAFPLGMDDIAEERILEALAAFFAQEKKTLLLNANG